MKNHAYWLTAMLAGALLLVSGCGGGGGEAPGRTMSGGSGTGPSKDGTGTVKGGSGNLAVFLSDAASDYVLGFKINITAATLSNSGGQQATLLATPVAVEVKHLQLAPTLLLQAKSLPAGTYDTLTLQVANPRLQVSDGSGRLTDVAATTAPAAVLAKSSVPVKINLTIADGTNNGLVLDLDLGQSLTYDTTANYSVSPVLTGAPVNFSEPKLQLRSVLAKITALNANGSADVLLLDSQTPVHLITDGNTGFDTIIGSFSMLKVGQIVELDARLLNTGNFLAAYLNAGPPDLSLMVRGVVTAVGLDSNGIPLVSVATGPSQ